MGTMLAINRDGEVVFFHVPIYNEMSLKFKQTNVNFYFKKSYMV